VWIDEGPVREVAEGAVARGASGMARASGPPRARAVRVPADVMGELVGALGPERAPKVAERLDMARRSFERERYQEARSLLAPLTQEAPDVAALRELHGLTLYRLERWKSAAVELEAYRALTGAVDQLPVLADCYRAQRRYAKVDEVWTELKEASPSAGLVAEGRMVAAGALADRGKLQDAIALLERAAAARPKRVRPYHLRQWYVLADLYDRAGDAPRARALFARIRDHDPEFEDASARLAALGR
jgi:tetratricopeptide (TPR) repeat protein